MSLTFYYAPNSTASITEAVLAELGVACERVRLDISAGDTRAAEFLAINPNGRVPVLVHEGTPIWESAAITMYLGELLGVAAGLYPGPGVARGEAMKWIVWSNVTLAEAGGRLAALLPSGSDGAVQSNSVDWIPPAQRQRQRGRPGEVGHRPLSGDPRAHADRATVPARRVQPRGHPPARLRRLARRDGRRHDAVSCGHGVVAPLR